MKIFLSGEPGDQVSLPGPLPVLSTLLQLQGWGPQLWISLLLLCLPHHTGLARPQGETDLTSPQHTAYRHRQRSRRDSRHDKSKADTQISDPFNDVFKTTFQIRSV